MAYKKFDDPDPKVDQSAAKVYSTFDERFRRAMQGITNRCLGTAGLLWLGPNIGVGGSAGFATTSAVAVVINGVLSTCAATDNLFLPEGTQGTGTVAKYLVYTKDGTSATVGGPGNVVNMADYTTVALSSAAAKLPDLPDGGCALGYVNVCAPVATKLVFVNSAGYKVGNSGTTGTGTFVNLACMPYNG